MAHSHAHSLAHATLTPLDHLHKPNYLNLSYYFPLKPDVAPQDVFQDLSKGLRRAFNRVPWLGGSIHLREPGEGKDDWKPGQREIRWGHWDEDGPTPHQLRYHELGSQWTFAELREDTFPGNAYDHDELLEVPIEGDLVAGCDVIVAQANFLPGGCIVSMSANHAALDGTAMVFAMKLWADSCRSLQDPDFPFEGYPPESSDRTLLDRIWKEESAQRQDLKRADDDWTKGLTGVRDVCPTEAALGDAAIKERNNPNKTATDRKPVNRTFYVSAASQAILRKECEAAVGTGILSSNDIVTALMWRSLVRARAAASPTGLRTETTSVLESAVDGRTDFSKAQAVPPSYLGNNTFYNQAEVSLSDLLDPSVPLGKIARVIRDGAGRANSTALQDAYALIRDLPDYDLLRPRFRYMDGADLLVSNLLLFPVDQISFGTDKFSNGGCPEAVRLYMSKFNHHARCSYILPRRTPGGVELSMNLYEDEMEHLVRDEHFRRYCMDL
ncbi:hypothetical protein F5Y07DRAFT_383829 [Xylaria sp. FL0933]|nr:hypothetical protein F5Y07DRAFT_383829 [Xylaria sp. FL0933]